MKILLLVLIVVCIGLVVGRRTSYSKQPSAQTALNDPPEFRAYVQQSLAGLQTIQQAHNQTWHMDKLENWEFSQDTGKLRFTLPGGKTAQCDAQIIGSYDSDSRTWLWAWANPSLNPKLTHTSLKVKQYGEQNTIPRLTTAEWPATEQDGWEMAAVAVRLTDGNGAYRGPAGTASVFFSLGEIGLSKPNNK